ncbi:MAG: serine/threonine-protein kinase [Gammaproteobacteria bacterium]|nr:serine/threonine-protein kinase [Gammaproteobacteria bacterium]
MSDKHRDRLPRKSEIHWYRIKRILGQGGFGITYLAFDKNLNRDVVIKEYFPHRWSRRNDDLTVEHNTTENKVDFDWGLDRFISEGQMLAKFNHPNITQIFSVFRENGTAYIVMRYEDGITLRKVLKMVRAIEYDDLLLILSPILDGLKQVHAAGIVHRDIKPENIYIKNSGEPVLIDFGSARYAMGEKTNTITSIVTPGFAPIEQYADEEEKQGPWTDIYGLSATIYKTITGRNPPDAISRNNQILMGNKDPLVPLESLMRDRFPSEFLAAIDQGLSLKPQDRPETIEEWEKKLCLKKEDSSAHKQSLNIRGIKAATASENSTLSLELEEEVIETEYDEIEKNNNDVNLSEKLYRAVIPPESHSRYLPFFLAQEKRSLPRISWNPGAFFLAPLWFAYRKMFLSAFVLFPLIFISLFLLLHNVLSSSLNLDLYMLVNPVADLSFLGALLILMLLSGMFGNYLYFMHANRYVQAARIRHEDLTSQCQYLLDRSGGSSGMAIALVLAGSILLFTGYTSLVRLDRIADQKTETALQLIRQYQDLASNYYREKSEWPQNISQLDNGPNPQENFGAEAIHISDRLIVVEMASAMPMLTSSTWSLAAVASPADGKNDFEWSCGSISYPVYLLPEDCRIHLK